MCDCDSLITIDSGSQSDRLRHSLTRGHESRHYNCDHKTANIHHQPHLCNASSCHIFYSAPVIINKSRNICTCCFLYNKLPLKLHYIDTDRIEFDPTRWKRSWFQYLFWHLSFIKIRVWAATAAAGLLCSLFVSENQWNGWSSINGQ